MLHQVFFSVWSTRSLNQATIPQSASVCCRQRAGMPFSRQVTSTSKGGITKLWDTSLSSEAHWAFSFPGETKPWVPEEKLCSFVYTWHLIYYIKSIELQSMKPGDHSWMIFLNVSLYCAHRLVQRNPSFSKCYNSNRFAFKYCEK